MRLTFINKIKICWEVLKARSKHPHIAHEKQLSTFIKGYHAGLHDRELKIRENHETNNKRSS